MDKLDHSILRELLKNPTESFLKIAEKIGISPVTVQKRYEKMEKDGTILGTTIMTDLSLLGYNGKAFLFVKYSGRDNPERLKKPIIQVPNLFLYADIIGEFDALIMIAYRDTSEIKEICDKIRANCHVKQVQVAITCDTFFPVKEDYINNANELLQQKNNAF
jgi:DNA-binding Lrp family transcriptional regulator